MRKLNAALDMGIVYEETGGLYSKQYGSPPIDPIVLVKYMLVGFLYGIPSKRQMEYVATKFPLISPFSTHWHTTSANTSCGISSENGASVSAIVRWHCDPTSGQTSPVPDTTAWLQLS